MQNNQLTLRCPIHPNQNIYWISLDPVGSQFLCYNCSAQRQSHHSNSIGLNELISDPAWIYESKGLTHPYRNFYDKYAKELFEININFKFQELRSTFNDLLDRAGKQIINNFNLLQNEILKVRALIEGATGYKHFKQVYSDLVIHQSEACLYPCVSQQQQQFDELSVKFNDFLTKSLKPDNQFHKEILDIKQSHYELSNLIKDSFEMIQSQLIAQTNDLIDLFEYA